MELISKKDLLALMDISYGQLYRWKRKKLLPEEWFIKKSSYTGQETFLPKDKTVQRIELILSLKEEHSLDELADIITSTEPINTSGVSKCDLDEGMFSTWIMDELNEDELDYPQLMQACILEELQNHLQIEEGYERLKEQLQILDYVNKNYIILLNEQGHYIIYDTTGDLYTEPNQFKEIINTETYGIYIRKLLKGE